jgi:hypothetical protein
MPIIRRHNENTHVKTSTHWRHKNLLKLNAKKKTEKETKTAQLTTSAPRRLNSRTAYTGCIQPRDGRTTVCPSDNHKQPVQIILLIFTLSTLKKHNELEKSVGTEIYPMHGQLVILPQYHSSRHMAHNIQCNNSRQNTTIHDKQIQAGDKRNRTENKQAPNSPQNLTMRWR